MKGLTLTGKIKTIIVLILFINNLIFVDVKTPDIGIFPGAIALVFGAFALPLVMRMNLALSFIKMKIETPHWNDNPLFLNRPLIFFQFGAWIMIAQALGTIIGSAIFLQHFSMFGLTVLLFAIGILIGIILTVKWFKN